MVDQPFVDQRGHPPDSGHGGLTDTKTQTIAVALDRVGRVTGRVGLLVVSEGVAAHTVSAVVEVLARVRAEPEGPIGHFEYPSCPSARHMRQDRVGLAAQMVVAHPGGAPVRPDRLLAHPSPGKISQPFSQSDAGSTKPCLDRGFGDAQRASDLGHGAILEVVPPYRLRLLAWQRGHSSFKIWVGGQRRGIRRGVGPGFGLSMAPVGFALLRAPRQTSGHSGDPSHRLVARGDVSPPARCDGVGLLDDILRLVGAQAVQRPGQARRVSDVQLAEIRWFVGGHIAMVAPSSSGWKRVPREVSELHGHPPHA